MAKKDKIDYDEELEKIAHKTNVNMKKSEFAFESQLKKLDKDIENITKQKIKDFDESKKLTEEYLTIDYRQDTIDRYREKLKRI